MTMMLLMVYLGAGQEKQDVSFERNLLVTLPEGAGDYWLTFAKGGRSVVFSVTEDGKKHRVIGGRRGEGFDQILGIRKSADGRSFAYFARNGEEWFVVTPEKKLGSYDQVGGMVLAPDGHPVYGAQKGGKWRIYGGKEQAEFDGVGDPVLNAKGEQLVYFAKRGEGWDVVADGKTIAEGFDDVRPELMPPVFSAEGKRLAYAGSKKGKWTVVVGDRRYEGFDGVHDLQFSADGRRFGYVAERGEKDLVVVDGENQEEFDSVWGLVFSPDGKTVAYGAQEGGASFVVVGGKRGPEFEDAQPEGFSPDGRSLAYVARKGGEEFLVVREELGERFDVRHRLDQGYGVVGDSVFSRNGSRVAYAASREGREFIVVGEEKSEGFDQVWAPVFDADGKRVAFGARKGRELWWEVWTVETKADRVKRRLLELIDLAKAGDWRKAADYVVYSGDDEKRRWKDVCNPEDQEEARGVGEVCGRTRAELGEGFEWGNFKTKSEGEGEWCVWEVFTGKEKKKRHYCFLLVKGKYAIGDID